MPALSGGVRGGGKPRGGIVSYPSERLFEEVAYLSHYLGWPYEQVMALDHRERQRWVAQVSRMNERINELAGRGR